MTTPLWCALVVFGLAGVARAADGETPNQRLLKTDLLVVTAHPDDEGMMGATMARYADQGKVVALVTCTHGEGGGNGTGKESGEALGLVREAELRNCLRTLGVRHLYFLNQLDWAYTESVRATLAKWGHEESLRRLVRLVRLLRPEVICTMDPAPVGGQHGHHQAAGRLATEAFEAAADPKMFPELARDEGLAPWRVRKLYWVSFAGRGATVQLATDGKAHGALAASAPGKTYAEIAMAAASNHHSQGFDKWMSMPGARRMFAARPNGFLLVKSRVRLKPNEEKDLFDGIAGAKLDGPEAQHDVLAALLPSPAPLAPVTAHLRPRDNIIHYRAWLRANGIERLMVRLPAKVTVVRGRDDNRIDVEVTNHSAESQSGKVGLEVPQGWKLEDKQLPFAVPARRTAVVTFRCTVPADAAVKAHDVAVRLGDATDVGKLDVVPALTVRRLANALPVDADPAKWEQAGVKSVDIPPGNLLGGFGGPAGNTGECSGKFYVGYTDDGLQVLVDVTDNTVAHNIAPDDIKAHWRSTSVEICVDPTPRSENTFSTLKLGIFPEDTAGKVRAARDADARQGELHKIGSKIQLASRRTETGYVVEARIPWAEIGVRDTARPGQLGFNVILYHAGKEDARVGEDIGKSRLAWSPWSGVPGRPEVWGMAVCE